MSYEADIKQKEQKHIYFTVTKNFEQFPLTGATLTLKIENRNGAVKITKDDAEFDKTDISQGKFNVLLTETDLDLDPGRYKGEVKIELDSLIDKTLEFYIRIDEAIT